MPGTNDKDVNMTGGFHLSLVADIINPKDFQFYLVYLLDHQNGM